MTQTNNKIGIKVNIDGCIHNIKKWNMTRKTLTIWELGHWNDDPNVWINMDDIENIEMLGDIMEGNSIQIGI